MIVVSYQSFAATVGAPGSLSGIILFGRVIQLVLARSLEALLDASVLPEGFDGRANLGW